MAAAVGCLVTNLQQTWSYRYWWHTVAHSFHKGVHSTGMTVSLYGMATTTDKCTQLSC